MKNRFLFFIVSLTVCILIFPKSGWPQKVKSLTAKHGLPQSFVSGLAQDKNDFVWISTRNGLSRYDGNSFRLFRNNVLDHKTIASNLTAALKQFNGQLWIEFDDGAIDRFDIQKESFDHILNAGNIAKTGLHFRRRSWIVDKHNHIWGINDRGIVERYDFQKKSHSQLPYSTHSSKSIALALHYDPAKDILWILNPSGISKFDIKLEQLEQINNPFENQWNKKSELISSLNPTLHQRSNGTLLWGSGDQLFEYDPVAQHFRVAFTFSPSAHCNISLFQRDAAGNDYFERNGIIYRYAPKSLPQVIYEGIAPSALPVQSLLIDKSDMIWIGTNAQGIVQIDLQTPDFAATIEPNSSITEILHQINIPLHSTFNWLPSDNHFAAPDYHLRSVYDKKQEHLWIALKETVVCYNTLSGKMERLPAVTGLTSARSEGIPIKGIALTAEQVPVVIGFDGNISIYDREHKIWKALIPSGAIIKKLGSDVEIRDMLIDDESIWITTEQNGLLRVDQKTKAVQLIKGGKALGALPSDRLLSLHQDNKRPGTLWIGSYSGLIALDKVSLKTVVYDETSGLPDNTIYGILNDKAGNIWFTTNKGLVCLWPETGQVRTFQSRHGLPDDEFNRFHQMQLPDGSLAFGGTKGWIQFYPELIKEDIFQPNVAITGLKIYHEDVTHQTHPDILSVPLEQLERLQLQYDQNTITISFAGLQYNQPEDIKYRYKLEGYDKEWIDAGTINFASYTKLPPGHYQFIVNCSNTSGIWSDQIRKLNITITPPWWLNWWAYMLYASITIGALWYIARIRFARIRLKQSILQKNQETQQMKVLNEVKTRFFTNVAHDFRTPLTLILTPARLLAGNMKDDLQEQHLATIDSNAEKLLDLINQLLDLSKLEANALQVNTVHEDLPAFVTKHIQSFKAAAAHKNIELIYTSSLTGLYEFDPPKLKSILDNLISNALKFTAEQGTIRIQLDQMEEDQVRLLIKDSGIGISAANLPFIFDRYFQGESNEKHQGSGIGLAMVKELVVLCKGSITVESEQGQGTQFEIRLPLRKVSGNFTEEQLPHPPESDVTEDSFDSATAKNTILVVEDNAELAAFIARSLSDFYEVKMVSDGRQGLEYATLELPDLIISDVMMPVMDGLELCKAIKSTEQTAHIPVILLTAKADIDSKIEGLRSGADDYLSKPFYVKELLLKINNLILRRQQLQQLFQESAANQSQKPEETMDPFLEKIYQLVEDNLDSSAVGVETVAEKLFISRVQLYRKVKALTGLSPNDVMRNYRLKRSLDFLSAGFSSSEAAYKSGFESPAYFSKCFKVHFGKTPSEMIKVLKG